MALTRIVLIVLVGSVLAACAMWITLVSGRAVLPANLAVWVGAGWVVAAMSLPALACAMAHDHAIAPRWMLSGVIASIAGALMWLLGLVALNAAPVHEWIFLATTPTAWAVLMMCTAVLLGPVILVRSGQWLRRATIAVWVIAIGWGASAFIVYAPLAPMLSWPEREAYIEKHARGAAIPATIAGVGSLVTLLCGWWAPVSGRPRRHGAPQPFDATCPRCAHRESLRTGGARCTRCGLRIGVYVP